MELNELIDFYVAKNNKVEELWRLLWYRKMFIKNKRIRKQNERN